MSETQRRILAVLGQRSLSLADVAREAGTTPAACSRALDALYRRGLATITPLGRWCATARGRRRVA